jgi:hypothetical protein
MRKYLLSLLLVILVSCSAYASFSVDVGSVFSDGTHDYEVNTQFAISTSINPQNGELYIDSIPYCSYPNKDYFSTTRNCGSTPSVASTQDDEIIPEDDEIIPEDDDAAIINGFKMFLNKELVEFENGKVFRVKHLICIIFLLIILAIIIAIINSKREK